jgi:hypothetical protein
MTTNREHPQQGNQPTEDPRAINERLEHIGWGLFLIMIGGLGLVPDEYVPEGLWLVGAGLIMLGLNGARYVKGIRLSGFTIVLGLIALFSGVGDMFGLDLPVLAILLILIGANMLLKPYLEGKGIV